MSTSQYLTLLGTIVLVGVLATPDKDKTSLGVLIMLGLYVAAIVTWILS